MKQQTRRGVLFYSYHPSDRLLYEQLVKALRPLIREVDLSEWSILAGDDRAVKTRRGLESASLILLLLSPEYLASATCYQEMQDALERQRSGKTHVIPILLRSCDWLATPLSAVFALPSDQRAVTSWNVQEEAFFDIIQGIRRIIGLPQTAPSSTLSQEEQRNRNMLLTRVRKMWIEGLLERPFHQASHINLHLQERPDVLPNSWENQVQELHQDPHPLPEGMTIVQIYNDASGELLILGEPGAGKTVLLLELARTLLQRAQFDSTHPIPVVFHLSSFSPRKQPFEEWLIARLSDREGYAVPTQLARRWIKGRQILPLLDGLDEVAGETSDATVQAIIEFHCSKSVDSKPPLVVCCRSQEYEALSTRLPLSRAVEILPLTQEQVNQYIRQIRQIGSQLDGLQEVLQRNTELAQLARWPLMLNILTLAYQGAAPEDFPTEKTREAQQRQIFATYVQRMLDRGSRPKRFSRKQMVRWLVSLARQMRQCTQSEFYLEYMQPNWLKNWQIRLLYRLSLGLLGSLIFWLVFGLLDVLSIIRLTANSLHFGLIDSLVFGLLFGLVFGLSQIQIQPREAFTRSWRRTKQSIIVGLVSGLLNGLIVGLFFGLVVGLQYGSSVGRGIGLIYGLAFGLETGLVSGLLAGLSMAHQLDARIHPVSNQGCWGSIRNGLVGGLVVGLVSGLLGGSIEGLLSSGSPFNGLFGLVFGLVSLVVSWPVFGLGQIQIRPREVFTRPWKRTKQSVIVGLLFGLGTGLGTGLFFGRPMPMFGLGFGLTSGVLVGLTAGILHGLAVTNQPDGHAHLIPNQGIWDSLRNGLVFGLLIGLVVGVLVWLAGLLALRGLIYGLVISLIVGLASGLGTFFQHFTLRFWLWCSGTLPWRLAPFLNEMTKRLLLSRIGGSYIFRHPLLLDYLISLENSVNPPILDDQNSQQNKNE